MNRWERLVEQQCSGQQQGVAGGPGHLWTDAGGDSTVGRHCVRGCAHERVFISMEHAKQRVCSWGRCLHLGERPVGRAVCGEREGEGRELLPLQGGRSPFETAQGSLLPSGKFWANLRSSLKQRSPTVQTTRGEKQQSKVKVKT